MAVPGFFSHREPAMVATWPPMRDTQGYGMCCPVPQNPSQALRISVPTHEQHTGDPDARPQPPPKPLSPWVRSPNYPLLPRDCTMASTRAPKAKTRQARPTRKADLRTRLLAELRGRDKGIRLWNARPLKERKALAGGEGLDLSGAALAGVDLASLPLAGARFD